MTAKAIGGRGVLPRLQKVLCFQCINSTCYHSPTSHPMRSINISKGAGGVGHRNVWFGFAVHQFAESRSVGRQSMSRSAPHFRSRPTVPSFDATALDSHKALRSAARRVGSPLGARRRRIGPADAVAANARDGVSLVKIGAHVVALLPNAIRAVRKCERLRGENHSYRQGDTR
jgi:hypothetical protein